MPIIDPFLPVLEAWIHDIGRLDEIKAAERQERVNHAEASAKRAPKILAPFEKELGQEAIAALTEAVARHSRPNADDDSDLAVFLKDADRLDGIGAIGLPRVFAFYPDRPIYKPGDPFSVGKDTSEGHLRYSGKSTQLDALVRNMEWFADPRFGLRTETAVRLGIPRIELMIAFLYQLADELEIHRDQVDQLPVVQGIKEKLLLYKPSV